MELHGRDEELARLGEAVAGVAAGESAALLVLGEAGIGKSALLGAAAGRARAAGLLVLEARAAEHERDVPFGLAIDLLDEHVAGMHHRRVEAVGPDLAAVLPAAAPDAAPPPATDGAQRFRLHRALRALVEALGRERPVALVLDDVHWADAASLEFLLHLLRRPPRAPHLLLLGTRPVDPVPRLLDAARDTPGGGPLVLSPLGHAASLAVVEEALPDPAVRERVAREAGGNPLFLQELARVARDPAGRLPPSVMAAVALELAALPTTARALADGAAVAGDPFDPELAAAAAGADDALGPLDDLVAADLVRPSGDGREFRFRHPLVHRAVYDATPPAWRLGAHERAAAALAARGAGPALRAHHVERAGRPGDEAAIALLAEAGATTAGTVPHTAARWYRAALALLPDGDPARRLGLLGPMALAHADAGELTAAHAALEEALGLAGAAGSPGWLALLVACARVENLLGRLPAARARLTAALEVAAPEQRAILELNLAVHAFTAGDGPAMTAHARRAIASGHADAATLTAAESIAARGLLWTGDAPAEAAALLDRAAARFRQLDDAALAAGPDATISLGWAEVLSERFSAAEATLTRGLAVATAARQGWLLPILSLTHGNVLFNTLQLDRALGELQTAEETARLQGIPNLLQWALWMLALVHHERGETAEADRATQECAPLLAASGDWGPVVSGRCNLAAIVAERDPERGIRELLAAGGPNLERADATWATWLLRVLVRAAIDLGRLEDAGAWARYATEHAAARGLPIGAVRAAIARAEVLLARDDPEAAAALALGVLPGAEGVMLEEVTARLLAGRALAAAGRREEADVALQRVVADAGARHAFRLRDAAARELRRLGGRVSAAAWRTQAGAIHELTAREREIAELVARDATNKEVAAALFVSQKTVEHHLSRVYAKLGVRSRSQLASSFAERRAS